MEEEKTRADIEDQETEEKIEEEMEKGEVDEDVYSKEGTKKLEEGDEIDELEEGFMEGYNEEAQLAKCSFCGKILKDKFVEIQKKKEVYRFCSSSCAEKFKSKRK